jgi:hypothetical protein
MNVYIPSSLKTSKYEVEPYVNAAEQEMLERTFFRQVDDQY